MKALPSPRRSLHRIGLIVAALMATCWCASLRAGESAVIDTISLERGCMGCADAAVLVLRRDGTATLTVPGNARAGVAERSTRGRIAGSEFDALARLALAQGFFSLNDVYEDPTLRDGTWTTTAVHRGTQDKRVFVREDAAPDTLKRFNAAIDQARQAIAFTP